MTIHTKTFTAEVKAAPDGGEFTAIVSVFGNVDSVRDVVMPGAFTDSLKSWADSGDPIPTIWSHQWGDLDSHIGTVVEAKELLPGDPLLPAHLAGFGGLWVRCVLDDEGSATKVRKLLKGRRVKNFSFAYDIIEAASAERDGRYVTELRKLHILECGPCLIGANQATDLLAAKGGAAHLDALKAARDAIDGLLAAADEPAPTGDPAKSEEPADHPPVSGHPSRPRLASAVLALLDA